jgi:hypothetical protein
MKRILMATLLAFAAGAPAWAKLPAPQLTDEQKVKAEEAKQRTAWQGKMGAYQQCQAEVAVVDKYVKAMKAKGKDAKVPESAACVNPGPFTVAAAAPAAAAVPAPAAPAPAPAVKK